MSDHGARLRILVVEDNPATRRALHLGLREAGFDVYSADTVEDARRLVGREQYDVCVFDWMLPDGTGFEVQERLREAGSTAPVLMLTARDAVGDRVEGLTRGADDYLVKPFAFPELVARVRALARRVPRSGDGDARVGPLLLEARAADAVFAGTRLGLTPREFRLLRILCREPGATVSRDALVRDVLQAQQRGAMRDNLLDVHMSRLRRKLDGVRPQIEIRTIRGLGFRLEVTE